MAVKKRVNNNTDGRGFPTRLPDGFQTNDPRNAKMVRSIRAKFCETLANTGNVTAACQTAGVSRQTMYKWRQDNEEFAILWAAAEEAALDSLEQACRDRAVTGISRPVFYQGEQVATIQEYSDTNAQFLLKCKRYRENKLEVTGKDGAPLAAPAPLIIQFVGADGVVVDQEALGEAVKASQQGRE